MCDLMWSDPDDDIQGWGEKQSSPTAPAAVVRFSSGGTGTGCAFQGQAVCSFSFATDRFG